MSKLYCNLIKITILLLCIYNLTGCGKQRLEETNKAPEFKQSSYLFSVNDNETRELGDVSATDPDNDVLEYVVTPNTFLIANQTLFFTVTPNLSADIATQNYQASVTVSDGELTATQSVTIIVNNKDYSEILKTNTDDENAGELSNESAETTDTDDDGMGENAVNNIPIASPLTTQTDEDSSITITLEGIDIDGDSLQYGIVSEPTSGLLGNISGSTVTYTPNLNYSGTDSFSYKVNDGESDSNIASVMITINAVNNIPIASPLTTQTDEDSSITITLEGIDIDGDSLQYGIVSEPTSGLLGNISGSTVTYTPNLNYSGTDSFSYKVNDGESDSNIASVTITINAVNNTPIASPLTTQTDEDSSTIITLEGSDIDSDSLQYSIVSGPTRGLLGNISGSTVTYTPDPNDNGTDSFSYKVNDGESDSNIASVTITINAVNDSPAISGEPKNIAPAGIDYSFIPAAVDTDVSVGDAVDTLTYSITNGPSWANFDTTSGELSGTPNNDDVGAYDNIVVSVIDEAGEAASLDSFSIEVGKDFEGNNTLLETAVDDWVSGDTTTYGHISAWNVSEITDMGSLFLQKNSFNQDISGWDVSSVSSMEYMFYNARSFNQDISSWDVSNVTTMKSMFYGAMNFNQDISGWDVSSVSIMEYMFSNADVFNNGGVALNWADTSSVTNMSYMFLSTVSFNQDISNWDVSSVTDMQYMFKSASAFNNGGQTLDWADTSSVTNMAVMFFQANTFNQDISSWNVSSVTNMSYMFNNADTFNQDISDWNVSGVTSCDAFSQSSGLSDPIYLPNFTNCSP